MSLGRLTAETVNIIPSGRKLNNLCSVSLLCAIIRDKPNWTATFLSGHRCTTRKPNQTKPNFIHFSSRSKVPQANSLQKNSRRFRYGPPTIDTEQFPFELQLSKFCHSDVYPSGLLSWSHWITIWRKISDFSGKWCRTPNQSKSHWISGIFQSDLSGFRWEEGALGAGIITSVARPVFNPEFTFCWQLIQAL